MESPVDLAQASGGFNLRMGRRRASLARLAQCVGAKHYGLCGNAPSNKARTAKLQERSARASEGIHTIHNELALKK